MDFDALTPAQLDAEVASATRGLRLPCMGPAQLDKTLSRHKDNASFSSRVIAEAVRRQMAISPQYPA